MQRVARHPKKLQLYLAFGRSTTRIHAKGCASPLKVATLPRVRALDHANPRKGLCGSPAGTPKAATLPRVRALDHANPRKGLRVAPKSCNFTSRAGARLRESMQRVARHPKKLQLYLAFGRSTTRIHAKGCASPLKVATLPRVRAFDHANPRKGLHSRSMASVLVPALERKVDIPRCR